MNSDDVLNPTKREKANKSYFFYSLNDSNFEPIGTTNSTSIEHAISFFSIQKNLSIDNFNNIYGVMEVF